MVFPSPISPCNSRGKSHEGAAASLARRAPRQYVQKRPACALNSAQLSRTLAKASKDYLLGGKPQPSRQQRNRREHPVTSDRGEAVGTVARANTLRWSFSTAIAIDCSSLPWVSSIRSFWL